MLGESLLNHVDGAHLVQLGVELHDGLDVLSREGARDFNGSDNATYQVSEEFLPIAALIRGPTFLVSSA